MSLKYLRALLHTAYEQRRVGPGITSSRCLHAYGDPSIFIDTCSSALVSLLLLCVALLKVVYDSAFIFVAF